MHTLYEKIKYVFHNEDLINHALTHPSHYNKTKNTIFERLEFLGDRVLGLSIADYLYFTHGKDPEGQLAKKFGHLVCKDACLKIADTMGLLDYMRVNLLDVRPNSSVLSDALEAIIGAVYLDGGYEQAKSVVLHLWKPLLEQTATIKRDAKSLLQEWSQKKGYAIPIYEIINLEGPDHMPTFTVRARLVNLDKDAIATGYSRKQAEQEAAALLLQKVQ